MRHALTLLLTALFLSGCARYYYGQPNAYAKRFRDDSVVCAREVGVLSGNGQYARVTKNPFQHCMAARGWVREKKLEPVEYGWFRGVEGDEVIDLSVGVPQPSDGRSASGGGVALSRQMLCRRTWLAGPDWRARIREYQECLVQ